MIPVSAARTGNHRHGRVYVYFFAPAHRGGSEHYVLFGAKSTKNVGGSDSPHTPTNGPPAGSCLVGTVVLLHKIGWYHFINIMRLRCTFSPRRTGVVPSRLPARNFRIASTKNAGRYVLFGAKSSKNVGGSDSPRTPTNGPPAGGKVIPTGGRA